MKNKDKMATLSFAMSKLTQAKMLINDAMQLINDTIDDMEKDDMKYGEKD